MGLITKNKPKLWRLVRSCMLEQEIANEFACKHELSKVLRLKAIKLGKQFSHCEKLLALAGYPIPRF